MSARLGFEVIAGLEVVGDGLEGVLFGVEGLDAVAGVVELAEVGLVFALIKVGLGVEGLFGLEVASEHVHRVDVIGHRFDAGRTLSENSSSHFGSSNDAVCGIY